MVASERESDILRENTRVELMEGVIVEKYPDTPSREPRSLPLTVVQSHQLALMGWFGEQRLELIEGDILVMPPIGSKHMTSVMYESLLPRRSHCSTRCPGGINRRG